jgi:hypothetical protein
MILSDSLFDKLKTLDTCTMSNAIERLRSGSEMKGLSVGRCAAVFGTSRPCWATRLPAASVAIARP